MKRVLIEIILPAVIAVLFWAAVSSATQPTDQQRIARLEARVTLLQEAIKELKVEREGEIREYHFSSAAGKFVCRACNLEEGK